MTSELPADYRKVQKGQKSDDSAQAFLNFSRENLSISHSDIEQGFNRRTARCLKINRQMLLSLFAIALALVCFAFETVKMQKVLDNTRDLEVVKQELETLKHRIYEEDFLDELRKFEQQLYADEEGDGGDADIEAEDYDSNYDDYDTGDDYLGNYETTSASSEQTTAKTEDDKKNDEVVSTTEKHPGDLVKSENSKKKRFITEEPPGLHANGEIPVFPLALSRDRNDTKSDEFNSLAERTVYLKKYRDKKRQRPHKKVPDVKKSLKTRGLSRRHIRAPRQVFAAHYGADTSMFHEDDEHTGNGRARHNEGIFKAWRASEWMDDLGMNRYFSLGRDGRLTIHETGLYLVYAQIHYLDEHDENGFHLLVNGRPIMQCMVYSPGTGHKSRSCFSAQVTYFLTGDRIVLKDVGPARYTLFQGDKSFFGLAKLGDARQPQQQYQMRHNVSLQPQTTPR